MSRPLRSICVVGDGITGLSAATAFARALPQAQVSIVPARPDPAALADRLPMTLPGIHLFHAAIDLEELSLVRGGIATHLLGTRFQGWPRDWFHGFGEHGLKAGDIPFHALWQRNRQEPFARYGAAAILAEAGRFAHPSSDPASPLGGLLYALRLDPARYRERLAALTADLPRHAPLAGAEPSAAGIAALKLASGESFTADLYLDCTGPQALLRSALDTDYEDWGHWLPVPAVTLRDEPGDGAQPSDSVEAHATGWRWRSHLPDRTLVIDAGRDGDAIRPGRRPRPWHGNVLALGDAATALDPLYGTPLQLAHAGIQLALDLLPGRDMHALETAEYNRRAAEISERARDFHALHYLRSGRSDTFWAEATRQPPPTLARTLEQFERRGRLPPFEGESFDQDSWLAALLGLCVAPGESPLAAGVDLARVREAMAALRQRLDAAAGQAPAYADLLARMGAPR